MKKVLVWETLSLVSGGQRMTLAVMDLLKNDFEFYCLIPCKGQLSAELDSRGIQYTCLGDQTMPTGVKNKRVIFRYFWLSAKAITKALSVIRKYKPDMIYAPGPASLPWSAVCGSLSGRPVVWHLHHIFFDGATKKLLNFCGGFRSVKKIVAVSDIVGSQMKNQKALSKSFTVYNPVDYSKFSSGNPQKILDELNINKSGQIIIAQVALLQPQKKQDFVIETATALKHDGLSIKVILAGQSRPEDAEYLIRLQEFIKSACMAEDVYIIGQRTDVPDILATADIIMIPSSFEGFPLAGLEAAAAGCPVLAADEGGALEFIQKSGAGECFRFDDVKDAADHLLSVVEKKELYAASGKSYASICTPEHYALQMRVFFSEVL